MKRIFPLLLALALVICWLPVVASAATVATGQCGANAYWILNSSGVLTIAGDGALYDLQSTFTQCWRPYASDIKQVVVGDGITEIGTYSFYDCVNLVSVSLPDSLVTLDTYAFYNCSALTSIVIPDSVTKVYSSCFEGCISLTTVVLGSSVVSVGNRCFYNCTSLSTLYSYAVSPPKLGSFVFYYVSNSVNYLSDSLRAIYVPSDSVADYRLADQWISFAGWINAMSDAGDGSGAVVLPIVGVNISGPDTVELGGSAQYQANVYGSGEYDTAVTWSLDTQTTSSGTSIDASGLLMVADNETASYITIRATSVQDPTISGALTVTVTAASEDTTDPTDATDPTEAPDPTDPTTDSSSEDDDGFVWYGDLYLRDISTCSKAIAPYHLMVRDPDGLIFLYALSDRLFYDSESGCLAGVSVYSEIYVYADDLVIAEIPGAELDTWLFLGDDYNLSYVVNFNDPDNEFGFIWSDFNIYESDGLGDIQDSIDDIGDQIGGVQDSIDGVGEQIDELPGEISDVLDDKEAQAQTQGNESANQILDQIPDPSQNFLGALSSLVSVLMYDGTECVISMPDIYIPAIDGLFGQIDLLDAQEIDFEIYFAMMPENIMTLVRALFDVALVSYCLKELVGLIGGLANGFKDTDFSMED